MFEQLFEAQGLSLKTSLTIHQDDLPVVIFKPLVVFVINAFPLLTKLGFWGGGGMEVTADAQWVMSLGH